MRKIIYIVLIFNFTYLAVISCSDFDSEEHSGWEKFGNPEAWFTSNAVEDATINFGQSYRHQVTTGGVDSSNFIYKLSNQPSGMNISSSGLIVWTPNKSTQIKKHPEITIFIELPSGYVITQTYDLTVTGECSSGNILAIWSGDQRNSTDATKILGNVITYTDNSSSVKTASENYNFYDAAVHLTHGPTPTATTGNIFFYNQYNDTSNMYLFYMFGVAGSSSANSVNLDLFIDNNESTDAVVVSDDSGETVKQSSGCGSSDACYTGRYSYNSSKSDGAVIGPFSGNSFRIFVDKGGTSTINGSTSLTVGGLNSFKYYSKGGSSFALGDTDNFTIGYNGSFDCDN